MGKPRNGMRRCVCGHIFAIHFYGPEPHCLREGCACKDLPRTKERIKYSKEKSA